jgi:hypothetical protein
VCLKNLNTKNYKAQVWALVPQGKILSCEASAKDYFAVFGVTTRTISLLEELIAPPSLETLPSVENGQHNVRINYITLPVIYI